MPAGAYARQPRAPPAADDLIAFAYGQRAREAIAPTDLVADAKQVLAYPLNLATQRMRDGKRLSQLIVVRLDAAQLAPSTLARAADGVVVYSGVCSHRGSWRHCH